MQASFRSYLRWLPASPNPFQSINKVTKHVPSSYARSLSTSTITTAQSIRTAVANGQVDHGYQLFTQFYNNINAKPEPPSVQNNTSPPNPRYLAHVLLHALHRSHNPLNAASFAKMCMERGIKVHGQTFDTIFASISPPCDYTVPVKRTISTSKRPRLHLITAAVGLLKAARKSGHKHHSWMYDRVINTFLLQGEVLTAALLFITLVKEWNARRLAKEMDEIRAVEQSSLEAQPPTPRHTINSSHSILDRYFIAPQGIWMEKITAAIEEDRERPDNAVKRSSTRHGIAALNALVNLLEEDHQYFPGRWRLLQIIRSTLFAQYPDNATCKRLHEVMTRLCQRPAPMPGVDLFSYHILLRYSLRDKGSIDLGADVLGALCEAHQPSMVTYNILLHDLAYLGDTGTVKAVTSLLKAQNRFAMGPLPRIAKKVPSESSGQQRVVGYLSAHPVPRTDVYTVIAMMSEAIARGEPQTACNLILQLFPDLSDSPGISRASSSRRQSLQRAANLSPHFWATAQHAAAKSHSLSMSMRIWRLVIQAEKSQHHTQSCGMVPSLYSIEAYTSQFRLFLSKLRSIRRMLVDGHYSPQLFLEQYNHLLGLIQQVLITLRDRATGRARIIGFEFDDEAARILFALVEMLLRMQDQIPVSDQNESTGRALKLADVRLLPPRILGIIRGIMRHYGVPHPDSLLKLGFASYKEEPTSVSSSLRPSPAPSVSAVLSSRKRKRPTFKPKYSGINFRPSVPPKGVDYKRKPGIHRLDDGKIGKSLLTRLGQVERRAAIPPSQ